MLKALIIIIFNQSSCWPRLQLMTLKAAGCCCQLYWSSPSVFAVKCCRLLPSAVAFGLCHLLLLVSTARSRRSRLLMVIIGKWRLVRILENRFLVLASTVGQYKMVQILDKIITSWMPLLVDDVYSCRFLPLAVVIYNLLASPVVFIACCCRLHRCSKLLLLLFLINQAVGLAFSWWCL